MADSLKLRLQIQKPGGEKRLPSPPNSSCGDEVNKEASFITSFSLPTHYSPYIANGLSNSLPENYTIDHSVTTIAGSKRNHRIHNRKDRRVIMSESSSKYTLQTYRCTDCGKVYKHPNCLSKHQWEHSEQWEYTSKFLLTKHQQVQMLEAANILMNLDKKHKNFSDDDENYTQQDYESDIDIEMDDI
ncbi:hypothetical protein G6F38_005906 [Rhizopus arrhizus]|nr:hypothetical protein G6F38_005906 [Rhizopus arrhizus]